MNLTTVTLATLKNIVPLLEQKEALAAQIAALDKEINSLGADEAPAPAPVEAPKAVRKARKVRRKVVKPAAKPVKAVPAVPAMATPAVSFAPKPQAKSGRKPGNMAVRIQDLLQKAGKSGLSVKRIANSLGSTTNSVHVWFSVHKKLKQIKKIGVGHYAWVG